MRLRGAHFLLVAALAGSATLVFSYTSQLSFIGDEWQLAIGRRSWGPDAFLAPFNENLIAGLAAIYKVGFAVFGMGSPLPFYLVSMALFLLCAVLLFVYLERRVGAWAAAVAATLVLFLGAAHEDFFWAFQMGFFGSVAAGLGALIALDREDRRADRVACVLLLVSLAFGSVGLAFVAGGLADLAFGRGPRRSRAYVALGPLGLYVLWWLGWGHDAGGQVGVETALRTPRYVFEAAAGGLASLLGRDPIGADGRPTAIAQLLVVALTIGAGFRLARERRITRGTAVALTVALSYWILIGLDRTPDGRFALDSRYQYPSAVFLLLIAGELLRGVKFPRAAVAALVLVAATAVAGGTAGMSSHFSQWKGPSDQIRLQLAVLEVARPDVDPGFRISFPPSVTSTAGAYFAASRSFGSPAYGESELLTRSDVERRDADHELVAALGLRLEQTSHAPRGRCRAVVGAGSATALSSGDYRLYNWGSRTSAVRLGRFAASPSVALGRIPPGRVRSLSIPVDSSERDWELEPTGGSLRLCEGQMNPASA